jgi:hypothetical protein
MRSLVVFAFACALAGCGIQDQPERPETPPNAEQPPTATDVFAAPNEEFEPVEPTVFSIIGAPTVWDALAPLGQSFEPEGADPALTVRIRVSGDDQIADVLRTSLADDAINSEHIRIEFRREPEGWYATNAYVRQKCRRGPDPEIWTRAPCP